MTLILAFLFGPLGMLYSTILGAGIMFLLNIFIVFFIAGLGLIVMPISIVWSAVAVNGCNKALGATVIFGIIEYEYYDIKGMLRTLKWW